jgi:flagellar biosynthesis GTPase FlhF
MRLKSYFAGTVESAIARARQELGEDIMLIHSRRAAAEFSHLGAYEVVFAVTPVEATPVLSAKAAAPMVVPAVPPVRPLQQSADYSNVRAELTRLAISLEDSARPLPAESLAQLLSDQGVHPTLIFELLKQIKARTIFEKPNEEKLLTHLRCEMESRIQTNNEWGEDETWTKIAAFIGPPGCGKSSTMVKLAAKYGLSARRPCLLVSTDNVRIGASDQLRSFAAILGMAFELASTPAALGQIIEEHRSKALILIDTPGISGADVNDYDDLARFFATRSDIEKHLILSASMKNADVTRVVDRYRVFGPNRLLFTKLDETTTKGLIWSEAVRTGLPLSFWTNGQRIPEDIEEASKAELLNAILMQESRPNSATAGM